MARVHEVGSRRNYPLTSDTSLDEEGYCLTHAGNANNELQKTQSASDDFVGVNHKSTHEVTGYRREELESGGGPQPYYDEDGQGGMSVEQDSVVLLQCETGNEYTPGQSVYLSSTNGVANNSDSGTDTAVGKVFKYADLSDADGDSDLVPVDITGLGGA